MSGGNRQIKAMRDGVDVWRERLKRDWHTREREAEEKEDQRTTILATSRLWAFFCSSSLLPYLSSCGISPLTTHYSDHYWHLLQVLCSHFKLYVHIRNGKDFRPKECLVGFFEWPCTSLRGEVVSNCTCENLSVPVKAGRHLENVSITCVRFKIIAQYAQDKIDTVSCPYMRLTEANASNWLSWAEIMEKCILNLSKAQAKT